MREADRPAADAQTAAPGAPTKIKIVEMEIEARIEPYAGFLERGFFGGNEQAIDQFATCRRRSEVMDLSERMFAVSHGAAQVLCLVDGEVQIHMHPCRLRGKTAPVAGHADHVEFLQSLDDSLTKEDIVYPDIVVNEYQYAVGVRRIYARIIKFGQPAGVLGRNSRRDARIVTLPQQRDSERGFR